MTIDEQIAVLQAYKDGKTIQLSDIDAEEWFDVNDGDHKFNFSGYDYRVKPEPPKPKYRPYKNAEEVLEDFKEHGPFIREKEYETYHALVRITDDWITFGSAHRDADTALENYIWQDGTPFGKLEEK